MPFDATLGGLPGCDNEQVAEAFQTLVANCAAVGMDLKRSSYQQGKTLEFDPERQRFPHDIEANAMLRRFYRKPFEVPDHV